MWTRSAKANGFGWTRRRTVRSSCSTAGTSTRRLTGRSALAARSWRIPRLRNACLRLAAVLAMLYAGAIAAWGGAPPAIEAAPKVTEHIRKELQQKVYVLDLIPRQCTGKGTDR